MEYLSTHDKLLAIATCVGDIYTIPHHLFMKSAQVGECPHNYYSQLICQCMHAALLSRGAFLFCLVCICGAWIHKQCHTNVIHQWVALNAWWNLTIIISSYLLHWIVLHCLPSFHYALTASCPQQCPTSTAALSLHRLAWPRCPSEWNCSHQLH